MGQNRHVRIPPRYRPQYRPSGEQYARRLDRELGYGWSVKGEYLYVDFDHYTTFNSPPFGVNNIAPRDVKLNDHIFRAGMNYRFW